MSDKFNLKQIRLFWKKQAIKHRQSPAASWSDRNIIEMEIREIIKYLNDGDRVLDVGCANGYSTLQYACQKRISIHGIDIIPEMIKEARGRLKKSKILGKLDFQVGDIITLKEAPESYDKIIVVRLLINLHNWSRQLNGLMNCVRALKKGGLILLSDATVEGWKQLNRFRKEWNLPYIPMPPFNCYINQDKLIKATSAHLSLLKLIDFSSTYYIGTRVLKPLLIQVLGSNNDVANPDMIWNRWCSLLPSYGEYGIQKFFVFRKK